MKHYIFLGLADLALLLLAFFLVHLFNYGNLEISGRSLELLRLQVFIWLIVSLIFQKFTRLPRLSLINGSGLLLLPIPRLPCFGQLPPIFTHFQSNAKCVIYTLYYPFYVKRKAYNLPHFLPVSSQTQSV